MKRKSGLWQKIGFSFTVVAGILLHFLYGWLKNAVWISPFSAVNESTWEHMKLLFWPMLIFSCFQSFYFKNTENFWCVKLFGIMTGLILIPVLFYTYNGAIAKSPDWLNILIFFISAAVSFLLEKYLLTLKNFGCKHKRFAVAVLVITALCFIIFTFKTPKIGIFKDPLTNSYGI